MAVERSIDVRVRLKGTEQFKKGMKDVSQSLNWIDVTKGILGADIVEKTLGKIVDKLKVAADKSIEFESALAGVAKTTDFSDVGLKNFGNELMLLSQRIPITASELAGLAEVGGQLGIAESDLLEFTEVVAAMGVSTNMSAEDAATGIARIANIFNTKSKDFSKMGSTIVELGNNFATTESEIVNMSLRMAGMGAIVGMSEADILAFSSALSSIGIEEAAGGSSMQKLFQTIELAVAGGEPGRFAEIAGETAEAFEQMWKTNPAQAVEKFLTGLNDIEKAGGSAAATLQEMEIKEVRLIRSILGLANADGLLAKSLEMSNQAWEDGVALSEEAGKRYATAASRIQIAKNKVENKDISLGNIVAPASIGVKEFFGDWAAERSKAAKEIDLAEEVEDANEKFEKQKEIITDNAQSARNLAESIAAMGSPAELDTAGQSDYIAKMTALVALIPELNQLWNEETMSIKGGTDALFANIDAVEQMALASEDLKKSTNAADAYSIIEQNLQAQKAELALAEAELNTAKEEYDAYWEQARSSGKTDAEIEAGSQEFLADYSAAIKKEAELRAEVEKNEAALENYAYVVTDFEESSEAYAAAAGKMAEASTGISDSQQRAIEGLNLLQEMLTEAKNKYEEAQIEILETLDQATSGFAKIEMPDIEGPEAKIEGLDSQLDFLTKYSEALAKAKEMGVDSSIISQLSTGTLEDYTTLASIVSGTEEDVATINAKYAEVNAAKEALSAELAAAQTGLETTVTDIVAMANNLVDGVDVGNDLYKTGAANVQSLIDGINSKISALSISVNRVKSLNSQLGNTSTPDGKHAAGLDFVPKDGYIAELHKGEMVLTALEAKAYRAEQFTNYAMPNMIEDKNSAARRIYNQTYNDTTNFGTIVIREEDDIDKITDKIARKNKRRARGRGYM